MKSPAVHKTSQKGKQRVGMLRRSSIQGRSPPLILAASGRVTREPSFKGWKDETRECIWLATENAQISQNQRTAKKRPDIRNNSHWGIGSDKVWQDAPGKVQLRDKDTPRSPGRRPECLPGARLMMQSTWVVSGRSTRNPALELSLIWSVCSHLVLCSCWCCDNVSFFQLLLQRGPPLLV